MLPNRIKINKVAMKHIRLLILVLVGLLLSNHCCAYDFKVDGIRYNIIDAEAKEVEVTNEVNSHNEWVGYDGDIVIPSSVEYQGVTYKVVAIGNSAFREEEQDWNFEPWSTLNSVTISEGIKKIDSSAFSDCVVLKKLILPSTIEYIGSNAFNECRSIESFEMPNNVKKIEKYTFWRCKGLKNINLGNVAEIDYGAFGQCSILQSITLPNCIISLGERVFSDCI